MPEGIAVNRDTGRIPAGIVGSPRGSAGDDRNYSVSLR